LKPIEVLSFGLLPWFWQKSQGLVERLGLSSENEVIQALAFLAAATLSLQLMPFLLYRAFVTEQRHGFNKQNLDLFFKDIVLQMLLRVVPGPPIVAAVLYMVQRGGLYLAFIYGDLPWLSLWR
jgi:STE24 endopeptidase